MGNGDEEACNLECVGHQAVTVKTERSLIGREKRSYAGIKKVRRAGRYKLQYVVEEGTMSKDITELEAKSTAMRRMLVQDKTCKSSGKSAEEGMDVDEGRCISNP